MTMTDTITPDMLVRAWRMGYLSACHDPSQQAVVRANLAASEKDDSGGLEPHHPACTEYGDDSGCDRCNR